MTVDFGPLIEYVLLAAAAPVSVVATALLWKLAAKLGVDVSVARQQKFNQEAEISLKAGIMKTTELIDRKGWADVEVKNAVVNEALEYLLSRFPERYNEIARQVGAVSPEERHAAVSDSLLARLPDAAKSAGESPVTPQTPAAAPPVVVNLPPAAVPTALPPIAPE